MALLEGEVEPLGGDALALTHERRMADRFRIRGMLAQKSWVPSFAGSSLGRRLDRPSGRAWSRGDGA